ncbi:Uncharacterized protein APZ42_015639 [Daphnia magna]|uniref:Uncharacterized protein n=1 Tax=Daphnia magna TaxID=35525 RepID=A0A162NS15_9CRUS|nr:Uncharacterized protein APZ42_015639 [Daphnia magna]
MTTTDVYIVTFLPLFLDWIVLFWRVASRHASSAKTLSIIATYKNVFAAICNVCECNSGSTIHQ